LRIDAGSNQSGAIAIESWQSGSGGYVNSAAISGGIQVRDFGGSNFAQVTASGFNVGSDLRMKNMVIPVTIEEYDRYLTQIRNIESATYFYNWETKEMRVVPHIGFIAQTLPQEIQTEIEMSPNRGSEKRLGYNLSDFAGLTLVGIKALDHKQQGLEQRMIQMETENVSLKQELSILKGKYEKQQVMIERLIEGVSNGKIAWY